jgi:hypothetical protein
LGALNILIISLVLEYTYRDINRIYNYLTEVFMDKIIRQTAAKSSSNLKSLLHETNINFRLKNDIIHNLNLKISQTTGRGGKEHGFSGSLHSWNRKGRW